MNSDWCGSACGFQSFFTKEMGRSVGQQMLQQIAPEEPRELDVLLLRQSLGLSRVDCVLSWPILIRNADPR